MDLSLRSCCATFLSLAIIIAHVQSAPAAGQLAPAGNPQALYNIILELENVLYKLKDYAREVHAQQSQRKDPSYNPDSKSAADQELSELQNAAGQPQRPSGGVAQKPRPAQQPSTGTDASDISLKEALEYLVGLAKEKKIERRDHDIPFPLNDRENQ